MDKSKIVNDLDTVIGQLSLMQEEMKRKARSYDYVSDLATAINDIKHIIKEIKST